MNDPQKAVFDSFLKEMRNTCERMFNRKLSESALLDEHNELSVKVARLDRLSLKAAKERGELLAMIRELKKSEPEPTPEPSEVTPGFILGEVVKVRNTDSAIWNLKILDGIAGDSKYKYYCDGQYWNQCKKLTDTEKGLVK